MSTKRARQPVTKPSISAPDRGAPTCRACGFTGWPTAEQQPYRVCGGEKFKHLNAPVGAA